MSDNDDDIELPKYGQNHPKTYLGWTVCLKKADGDRNRADELCSEYVIGTTGSARRGAMQMGFVESPKRGEYQLTDAGAEVCTQLLRAIPGNNYGQVLDYFAELKGSSKRFVEAVEEWADVAPEIMLREPATEYLVSIMRGIPDGDDTLADVAFRTIERDARFGARYFLRDDPDVRGRVLGHRDLDDLDSVDPTVDIGVLKSNREVYRTPTVMQHKSMLFHMGVMTTPGGDPTREAFDPEEKLYVLEDDL